MKTKFLILGILFCIVFSSVGLAQEIAMQVFKGSFSNDHKTWSKWETPAIPTKILIRSKEVILDMGPEGKETFKIVKDIYEEDGVKLIDVNILVKCVMKDIEGIVCMCQLVFQPSDRTYIFNLSYQEGTVYENVEYKFICIDITQ
jgi:hypothetical protein